MELFFQDPLHPGPRLLAMQKHVAWPTVHLGGGYRYLPAVHQHLIQRDRERGVMAMHHHGHAVPNQQDVQIGLVHL
eukprot:scaffold55239_cov18-Tisochrysis_lutea.AAC.5